MNTERDPYAYRPMPSAPTPPVAPSAAWYDPYAAPSSGWPVPPAAPPRRRNRGALIGLGTFAVAALVLGGASLTVGGGSTIAGSGTIDTVDPATPGSGGALPGGGSTPGSGSGQGAGRSGTASAIQQVGVVTIVSTLKYQQAQSAGTGMILSADGEVLTNNHVIRGATSVVVTVETTGRSYRATVVGTAPASDVAVIKMQGASGLQTAKLADTAADVRVGDAVTGVGNAGGTGTLTAAAGKVTGLGQSITASDETGQDAERLSDLIEVNARIISGDSGGPLYDADGEIIGMNTAASSARSATSTAYAITVDNAIALAEKIEAGVETTAIHIGYPGFLGVSTKDANGRGAAVAGLLDGGPAEGAGLATGSVITGVDGTTVTSAQSLKAALTGKDPGTKVTVTWTDPNGQSRSAQMTLATGPAD